MGFLDRIRSLFRISSGTRAGPKLLPAGERGDLRADFTGTFAGGFLLNRRGDVDLLRAFGEDVWLHTTVGRRGETLAPVEPTLHRIKKGTARMARRMAVRALEKRQKGAPTRRDVLDELVAQDLVEEVLDHELLDLLERPLRPQPGMMGMAGTEFWELLSNYMDMLGEALLVKERSGRKVIGLIPVPPTQLREVPIPTKPGFAIAALTGKLIRIEDNDVVWFRRRDLVNPLLGRGQGTARALQNEIELDQYMAAAARARFANGGIPELILGLKGNMSEEAFKRFADELEEKHRGPERAGQMHLLKGEFVAQSLGHTNVEQQWVQGRTFGRDTHMQGFGMPPEVVGVLANSNKSTIQAAGGHMWRYSTVPMLERLFSRLQMDLVETDFGDDLILGYRSMEPADEQRSDDIIKALPGCATKNEIRARAGLPPRADGEAYYAQPGAGPSVPVAGGAPKQAEEPAAPVKVDDPNKEDAVDDIPAQE